MVRQTSKQSNKQTTKVIVKIGSDIPKPKRRQVRRQKKVEKEPPSQPMRPVPQSFGFLAPQNTAFSSNIQSSLENVLKQQANLNELFNKLQSSSKPSLPPLTSNIKNPLENILKDESDLNKVVDKLREQKPEDNEGQNAQIVSGLNLNNEEPINYGALMNRDQGTQMDTEFSNIGTQTGEGEENKTKDQATQSKSIGEIVEEDERRKREEEKQKEEEDEMNLLFGTTSEEQEKLRERDKKEREKLEREKKQKEDEEFDRLLEESSREQEEEERQKRKKERERIIKSKSKERELPSPSPSPGGIKFQLEKFEKEVGLKDKPTGDLFYALRRQNFEKEIQKIKDRGNLMLWMFNNREKIDFKQLFPQKGVPSPYS